MPREQQQINYSIIILIVLTLLVIAFICAGCRGPDGQPGANGLPGQIGAQGPIGMTVPVYTSLATNTECLNGGLDVTIGDTTTTLCNGLNGSNGVNATPVVFEQVCQSITPSYPSTFPEFIMNVNGQAYGVYSANGGFLALLPPGAYNSNGINVSCTFTINQDGSVTQ